MSAKDKDPVVDSDSEDDVPPSLSDDDEAAPPMAMRTLTDEVELWCSAEEFETVWSGCFDRCPPALCSFIRRYVAASLRRREGDQICEGAPGCHCVSLPLSLIVPPSTRSPFSNWRPGY